MKAKTKLISSPSLPKQAGGDLNLCMWIAETKHWGGTIMICIIVQNFV